jgi:hypothetical protein
LAILLPRQRDTLASFSQGSCDFVRERTIKVCYRFKGILTAWPGDQPCDLLVVSLDYNFFAFGDYRVEHTPEVTSQFGCGYGLHLLIRTYSCREHLDAIARSLKHE